jgi:hypothetical protein
LQHEIEDRGSDRDKDLFFTVVKCFDGQEEKPPQGGEEPLVSGRDISQQHASSYSSKHRYIDMGAAGLPRKNICKSKRALKSRASRLDKYYNVVQGSS